LRGVYFFFNWKKRAGASLFEPPRLFFQRTHYQLLDTPVRKRLTCCPSRNRGWSKFELDCNGTLRDSRNIAMLNQPGKFGRIPPPFRAKLPILLYRNHYFPYPIAKNPKHSPCTMQLFIYSFLFCVKPLSPAMQWLVQKLADVPGFGYRVEFWGIDPI
jgi:hypothetical protein